VERQSNQLHILVGLHSVIDCFPHQWFCCYHPLVYPSVSFDKKESLTNVFGTVFVGNIQKE
jgi:hypothetical protein